VDGLRRSPGERVLAWMVTDRVGHFYSATADIALFWARQAAERVRSSVRGPLG
jgi:hypothetical protein